MNHFGQSPFPPDPAPVAESAAADAIARLADDGFRTWRCGTLLPAALRGADSLAKDLYRRRVQETLLPRLAAAWPDRVFDRVEADVVVHARPDQGGAALTIAPVLVAGRYRKLVRDMSQTVFHCRVCRGRKARGRESCAECGGTGRYVPLAVESFVRSAILRAVRGRRAAFHGAGREDVDVRMLGTGRPFVVSVDKPLVRAIDGEKVAAEVAQRSDGRITLSDLRVVRRDEARTITRDHGIKTYRAVVTPAPGEQIPADAAQRLAALAGTTLAQRTPQRVEVRRADLVRERRVLDLAVEQAGPDRVVLTIRTEPGTYVKEFVSGDSGRTSPSVAHALGVACNCAELDVIDVEGSGNGVRGSGSEPQASFPTPDP